MSNYNTSRTDIISEDNNKIFLNKLNNNLINTDIGESVDVFDFSIIYISNMAI